MAASSASGAQRLHAAGADGRLWVVRGTADDGMVEVFTRRTADAGDGAAMLQPARRLNGRLAPAGAAAAGGKLWLVFADGPVVTIEAVVDAGRTPRAGATLFRTSTEPRLPTDIEALALAADGRGLWVLGRETAADVVAADAAADTAATSGLALLVLRRSAWERVDLPRAVADWSPRQANEHALALLITDAGQRHPVILTARRGGGDAVTLYRYGPRTDDAGEAGAWEAETHTVTTGTRLHAVAVDGQVLLGREHYGEDWLGVELSLLRPQRVAEVGELTLASSLPPRPWALTSDGRQALLVSLSESDGAVATWTGMDLRGRVTIEPGELREQARPAIMADPDFVVLMTTLVLASGLVLLVFARREPGTGGPQLAAGLQAADVGRRLAGGAIDLLPWAAAVMLSRGDFDVQHLLVSWPGRSGGWRTMGLGAAVIGLYVVYCVIAELIAGRTLGKLLLGMRVAALDGQRARAWRIVVRNVLKVLDLIVWPLLLLPLFTPLRQRLGDMAADTVVLMKAPGGDTRSHGRAAGHDTGHDGDHDGERDGDQDGDPDGDQERDP